MPRSFDMSVDYEGSVEQVRRAFGDEKYWLARLADSGVAAATLKSIEVGGDGTIAVASTLVLPREFLPAVATQFHSGDLRIERRETWGPVTDGRASGTIDCAIVGAPATMTGKASLTPKPAPEPAPNPGADPHTNGSIAQMHLHATVEVRIPFVGGKLESFIGGQLTNLLIEEQRFTTMWLAQET
jgi:Protein of unknown function (DUF2505)